MLSVQRVGKFNPPSGLKNILLLEDDSDQRGLIKNMLRSFQCDVLEAETPSEAWKYIESTQIDLAIVDLCLPGNEGDGLSFVGRMRESQHCKDTPVLMISGMPSRKAVSESQKLRCMNFLTKPLSAERLTDTIRNTGLIRMLPFQHKEEVQETDSLKTPRTPFDVPCNVVLVDKDPARIATFKSTLKNTNWSLEVISDFDEVISHLNQKPAQLVFLDIHQHTKTEAAVDVCVQIQDGEELSDVRVVALGLSEHEGPILMAKEKGISNFVLDRITRDKLLAVGGFLLEN